MHWWLLYMGLVGLVIGPLGFYGFSLVNGGYVS